MSNDVNFHKTILSNRTSALIIYYSKKSLSSNFVKYTALGVFVAATLSLLVALLMHYGAGIHAHIGQGFVGTRGWLPTITSALSAATSIFILYLNHRFSKQGYQYQYKKIQFEITKDTSSQDEGIDFKEGESK